MIDAEREMLLWGTLMLLVFLTTCAVIDMIEQSKPVVIVVEYGPPPSMVTQLLDEAKEITRRAAEGDDTDDAR